ncbi:ribonuclease H-like protein [Ascobolus immersus RN42]|uniref:RNA exonuclease 4 n=1 Tax=Ascobolus immersus RN42 TaxID=1160509 RepID=A0A3N4I2W4_ASCIM|nr:ribonuclease H-like protein [Ascobolus immersus RN42]
MSTEIPVPITQLSSNWKNLQKQLGLGKRKRTTDSEETSKPKKQTTEAPKKKKPTTTTPAEPAKVHKQKQKRRDANQKAKGIDGRVAYTPGKPKPKANNRKFQKLRQDGQKQAQDQKTQADAEAAGPKETHKTKPGRYLALDCEMVEVGGSGNPRNALARVSIVNYHEHVLLDLYVKPDEPVTDYRTAISGITPALINSPDAVSFKEAQEKVSELVKDRILIGHALKNDLKVLLLSHPRHQIRDTAALTSLRKKYSAGKTPALRMLAKKELGLEMKKGSHDSVEDASVALMLYKRHKDEFEEGFRRREGNEKKGKPAGAKKGKVDLATKAKERDDDGIKDPYKGYCGTLGEYEDLVAEGAISSGSEDEGEYSEGDYSEGEHSDGEEDDE